MFALTWLSYASYYFTRKNLSVVKSRLYDTLHISTTALGTIAAVTDHRSRKRVKQDHAGR